MKKILIFLSIFFMFTINTFAYVDYTELESSDSYQFNDDFSKVKLLDNYYIWGERDVLYIVTSNKELQIDERSGSFYIRCYLDNCSNEITTYTYRKNSKGQYTYQSTSSYGPEITYNFKIDLRQTVESSINKVSYKEFFPNLTTFYSNKELKERYVQVTLPVKELPTAYKAQLGRKTDIFTDIGDGFNKIFGGLGNWFTQLFSKLDTLKNTITSLPSLIVDGIVDSLKSLFIPSDNFFKDKFDSFNSKIANAFNLDISKFSVLNSGSKELDSFTFMYMNNKVTLLDKKILNDGLNLVRPYIQGFFYLLILLYNLNQFLSLFGQSKSTEGGSSKSDS